MTIRLAPDNEKPRLFEIWRGAVAGTRDFLSDADRAETADQVRDAYLPSVTPLVFADENDRALAFMGVAAANIDALFVDPSTFGQGIGRALTETMFDRFDEVTVQVNEQNPGAHGFYRNLGFVDTRRDPTDDEGRPFPIIHMTWRRGRH